ncbi:unnamed protein product [Rotaria sp. Silwood2]|nr:unnamed protein product [Rotaria sp. Silwood2]CAF4589815.1 unnamed protein product [Rotaria sp. Silwood2]
MIKFIINSNVWLLLITVLYGGYKNYKIQSSISEYYEIAQFLELSNIERAPFTFYYQEIWDRDDAAYSMAVYLNTKVTKEHWTEKPIFDKNDIYKESYLTNKILELLQEEKSTTYLIEDLQKQISTQQLNEREQIEKNPELTPLVVLLNFGINSKFNDRRTIYRNLLPELNEQVDVKKFLLERIESMCNPYYKSRALYQLAEFYDEKSYELLNKSFILTESIQEPTLKFQVLEKIFSIIHYKEVDRTAFIQKIVDELIVTFDNIDNLYNRIISSIRLSFYGSREFRKKYLAIPIETLDRMDEDNDKIKLIIKLKPLINIYDDLLIKLNGTIERLKNKMHNYFVNSYYGRILFTETLHVSKSTLLNSNINQHIENENDNKEIINIPNYTELQSLFVLIALLYDTKLVIGKTDDTNQLWIELFKDTNNRSNIEKILIIGLHDGIFLTPQVAIIIDELIKKGEEDRISILFPYIIKPSNEVLPVVQR